MFDELQHRVVPVAEDQVFEAVQEDDAALRMFVEEDLDRLREVHDRGWTEDVVRGRVGEPQDPAVLEAELLPRQVRIDTGDAHPREALAHELAVHAEAQLRLRLLHEIARSLQKFHGTRTGLASQSRCGTLFDGLRRAGLGVG